MVTHNWSNLFRDLVAAIVADALGEPDFAFIAKLMDKHMTVLRGLLTSEMRARTYWVCALSVNQHRGICAANPFRSVDSLTGFEHPVCSCGCPKYFNSDPPLRDDGKSILCEINKFDDMIAYLAATNSKFVQVIAVDAGFDLFSRAWCVAEIAESHKMGVKQRLKIHSQEALEQSRDCLRSMDIQKMQASRPEDVQEILSKIADPYAFNLYMQEILFNEEGLLLLWRLLDAKQMTLEVGRVALIAGTFGPWSAAPMPQTIGDAKL